MQKGNYTSQYELLSFSEKFRCKDNTSFCRVFDFFLQMFALFCKIRKKRKKSLQCFSMKFSRKFDIKPMLCTRKAYI